MQPRSGDMPFKLGGETNEYGARITADSRGHFKLLPVLPLSNIDASLKEIEYAYTALKAAGICMPGSIGGKVSLGVVLGSDYPWSTIIDHADSLKHCELSAAQLTALDSENGLRMTRFT